AAPRARAGTRERCVPSPSRWRSRSLARSFAQHDLEILVTTPRKTDHHGLPSALARDRGQLGDPVRGLECGDDALGARKEREGVERLAVGARDIPYATAACERRVLRSDAWIVEPRRDRVGLADLAVLVLKDERARAVEHAHLSADDRRGVMPGLDALATRLDADELHRRVDLAHLGAQQLHPKDIRLLPARVDRAHVDHALETEQRARRGRRHAVLARPGFRDDPRLPHSFRKQRLADRAVDLVRARVRQVLALQEHARETDVAREMRRVGERRRAADPITEHARELVLERAVLASVEPGALELRDGGHERLGQVLAPEFAVATRASLDDHACTVRRTPAIPRMSGAGSSALMSAVPTRTASTRAGSSRASSTEL